MGNKTWRVHGMAWPQTTGDLTPAACAPISALAMPLIWNAAHNSACSLDTWTLLGGTRLKHLTSPHCFPTPTHKTFAGGRINTNNSSHPTRRSRWHYTTHAARLLPLAIQRPWVHGDAGYKPHLCPLQAPFMHTNTASLTAAMLSPSFTPTLHPPTVLHTQVGLNRTPSCTHATHLPLPHYLATRLRHNTFPSLHTSHSSRQHAGLIATPRAGHLPTPCHHATFARLAVILAPSYLPTVG